MSRRKQSNPKPLKAGEEEEWGSEGEADRASSDGSKQPSTPGETKPAAPAAASAAETPPPPVSPAPAPAPKLRLNTSLATDPALRVPLPAPPKTEPPGSPADLEYLATLPSALQTAIVAGRLFCVPPLSAAESVLSRTTDTADKLQATGPVYVCSPCAIKFSSLSTLEAHQTYYCSHRHGTQPKAIVGGSAGGVDSEPEDMKPVVEAVRDDVSGGESSTGEPAAKSAKSGKQYRCPHCSYSADKKVSLNRHMRMHSTSPASQTGSNVDTDSQHLVDRYCQDCDIRFSSLKTFKAHKMHYCSTRHVIKTKPISAPSSPSESRTTPTSPGASDTSNHHTREAPPQPFLALPTNPILIVPYSLFQGASILNGPVMGLPTQDTACLLLPDGTLQPLAQGLLTHNRIPPPQAPSEPTKRQRINSETVVKHSEESRSKNGVNETPGAPLDLSVRTREEEGDLIIDMEEEDEKENRRSVDNQANIFPSPDPEDIICAPSIPLMLSTSSTCSSPSPAPPSPALSSSSYSTNNRKPQETKRQRTDSQSSSPSPKSSPSGAKSPRRTPNGLQNASEKVFKSSDPKRKPSSESVSPPKLDNTNNNLTLSSLLLAAAAQGQIDGFPGKAEGGIPFPPELVSHLASARLAANKGKPIPAIPGLIPAAARNLPLLLPKPPRTPSDMMNPATILPLLTSEMALRIAAGADPAVGAPQVLVKQGVSKCLECNIVFCKHENYVAHKKHYCSARQLNDPVIVQDDDVKPASPAMSCSPPNTASPPTSIKDQAHSPVNTSALVTPASSVAKPTLYQFICAACGIKFTSYDNLSAHQAYYCPKRSSTENEKGSRRCSKCKLTVPMDHICGGGGAWKCPCCPVVSPTASAAQKHMDTHTGVKAFLCTICRYKGNTLRGMRTHIRMHFEKRSAEIMEENYITCLLEDGSGGNIEIPAVDPEENHIRKTPESNNVRSMNGASVKVKEEVERRGGVGEEDDDEYIEVEEVSIKTEPQVKSQDCNETKNVVLRRGEGVLSNMSRSLQVHR